MTAHAINHAKRRGACPGLSAPMATGDGLLVRLLPIGTIPLDAFVKLCAAAREHGNGIIEVTGRGSIQVRGLSPDSAPRFAAAIAALGIAAADGIPVLGNALAGLDPEEILDAGALAADLRRAFARGSLAARLSPKVSVAIDGGGALNLDGLAADVRLCAEVVDGRAALRVSFGGDAMSAVQLGVVKPEHGVDAAMRLLEVIARRGRDVRARDVLAVDGIAPFRAAVAIEAWSCDVALPGVERVGRRFRPRGSRLSRLAFPKGQRKKGDVIGLHWLRDGSLAYGIGLAFGHADAISLEKLAEAAGAVGVSGMRAAPGRAIMAIGLTHETASELAVHAECLGFIVRGDDPRRHVVVCAGAPICISAYIAARAMAPLIAETAAPYIDGSFTIHVSGCAKGCAHPALAALTVVGTPEGCALVANGATRDIPYSVVPANELPAAIARHARDRMGEGAHV